MSVLANGSWLTPERIRRIAMISGMASLCLLVWLGATSRGTLDWRGRPLGTDFSDVWTAGRMALDGHAVEAWNWGKHFAVQRAVHGSQLSEYYAWHYPPPFLLVASLLALVPYVPALLVWQLVTLAGLIGVVQRIVPGRDSLLLTLAAPVTIICIAHGQNGFLTATLISGGLLLLEDRPFAAGLLFGCLIYKPQFGLVLPVMLLAGRHWRTIAGALLSAGILIAITLALWGWPVWQAFLDSLPLTRTVIVENGATGFYKIMSPFAVVRMWGGPVGAAYVVQFIVSAAALSAVAWISYPSKDRLLRNALVCATALLGTPYVLDYDFVVLIPALAWLFEDGRNHGFLRWDATLMAMIWGAPLFGRPAAMTLHIPLALIAPLGIAIVALRRTLAGHAQSIGHVHPGGEY